MYIFPVIVFFCKGQSFWGKWLISQFLTRVTGGYVMLAEVVFRNVVTQEVYAGIYATMFIKYLCVSVSFPE